MKDNLYSMNDYELLYMVRAKDANALELLLKKYEQYMSYLMVNHFEPDGITSKEDLQQECRILLLSLVESYREDQGCRFLTYLVNGVRIRIGNRNRVHQRSEKGIKFVYSDEAVSFIAKNSFSRKFGARNLRRYIQTEIEDAAAQLIISNYNKKFTKIVFNLEDDRITVVGE